MIHETSNVSEEDVGFYSGLIVSSRPSYRAVAHEHDLMGCIGLTQGQESLFSLVQMMTMIAWGRAADRFGRKPILVVSLVGISVGTALFGFSKSIWQMAMCRCFAGVFAGTLV